MKEEAISTAAIHLASAQEFRKSGHSAAYYVSKMLAEDPGRFGPYLQEALEHIDDKKEPKVEVERSLATLLHKNIAGRLVHKIICPISDNSSPIYALTLERGRAF